jgi:hypothetical protein
MANTPQPIKEEHVKHNSNDREADNNRWRTYVGMMRHGYRSLRATLAITFKRKLRSILAEGKTFQVLMIIRSSHNAGGWLRFRR